MSVYSILFSYELILVAVIKVTTAIVILTNLASFLQNIWNFQKYFLPLQPIIKGCCLLAAEMIPSHLIRTMPA